MYINRANSDTTYEHIPPQKYERHFSDIRSRVDILHKMSKNVEIERKRNRVIITLIGTLVLVAEFVSIITKMLKD